MKRRREEVEDTADSREKKKRPGGMANLDNFWSNEKDALLLQEIANARSHLGPYAGLTSWSSTCWNIMHQRLVIANPDFQLLTAKHLRQRQSLIHTTTNVDFSSPEPPVGELDRLVYDAFQQDKLPPPPREILGVRRVRSRLGGVNVNNSSTRTTTNTTNINTSGSCSNASHIDSGKQLAELLLEVKDDLGDDNLFASLSKTGTYGVFSTMREKLTHSDFLDHLVKYGDNNS